MKFLTLPLSMARLSFLLLLFLCSLRGMSQVTAMITADGEKDMILRTETAQKEYVEKAYALRVGVDDGLINGRTYFPYHYRSKSKPLLFFEKDRTASISINGRNYKNVFLHYDTFTDEVIYPEIENKHAQGLYQVSLNKDIIDSFVLFFNDDTLTFRNVTVNEAASAGIPSGFYESAYDGDIKYIIRHTSAVHQKNGIGEYFYSPIGYVDTGSGFTRIRSNSKFIKLFGDRSAEMKKILDRYKINVRKANKNQITGALILIDNQ
jgi:hypothetical protein